ncbi:MAG: NAD(P)/FAD-dependent oxidoreductase [Acidobacteria bacterium]|nr:MAG: NAD(P)/FAD-dependent oxidoreductase [Acidobacteriota bacterium]PYQ79432.1 MAG: NAD(P)/FAD-dependent oxidoreductase [Acidobacteriota bacterium]PYQ91988.1 MAG: NAD(P)/FAD-dependent oxidoreductase [Acidobacteriota bacterium]
MAQTFDLIVIGSGTAAQNVASRCRAAGWTVAMIDKRPFGGTCALRGCDPKKVLVGAAAAVDAARLLSGKGVRPEAFAIDWAELIRFKRTFTDPRPETLKAKLARAGIAAFQESARFVGPTHLRVGDSTLNAARAIVVATGARPADLAFESREHVATSDQFLDLASLPPSIVFIGGGYVSFEFAHVAARAGVRVTIVNRGTRPLVEFDPDLVDRLIARTRALGVDVRLGAEARAIAAVDGRYRVTIDGPRGTEVIEADLVVHGAGRVPDVDDLALDVGGIQSSRAGIHVNQYLQSVSNPIVYAAGDCAATDGPALTPVASYEGRIVATNLLEGNHTTPSYDAIPSVVFTLPPLARVGLQESDAQAAGLRFVTHHEDTRAWYSSRRLGEECSAFKVLIEQDSRRIVGAHLLGPHADETINLFALGMRTGTTADRFKELLWAYPTHGSDIAHMV